MIKTKNHHILNNFQWQQDTSQFNKDFIKKYNEESDEGYFLKVCVQYPENLHDLHNDLPFLPEKMKFEKVEKLVTNLHDKHDKTEYVVHIRNLKKALDHRLILKKVYRVIIFNQKAWLKLYIDMITKLRQKAKNNFEKDFFRLMNNAAFGKTMENVRKHRNIKLIITGRRRYYLVSEPNYHTTKFFTENLLATEMRKTQIFMNKPLYLGLSILDLSKIAMHKFWYDYVNPKYGENEKLCYMDTESSIVHVKTDDIYKDIAEDVETRFDASNFETDRPLPKGTKNVIGLMKDELGGQIMKEFVGLRAKTYSYLKDNNDEDKKANDTKNCVIKREFKFQDYKNCLEAAKIENKINHLEKNKIDVDSPKEFIKNNKLLLRTQQIFKSERHNVFTEEINKVALSLIDDKRMKSIDSIETYAYEMNKDLVCKKEEIKFKNIIKQYKHV